MRNSETPSASDPSDEPASYSSSEAEDSPIEDEKPGPPEIAPDEANRLLAGETAGVLFVDVREKPELDNDGWIPG